MSTGQRDSNTKKLILNEGELRKKGGIFKRWRPRFVVLNEETLSIFHRKDDESKERAAKHSLPVTDISSIENYKSKKKSHCFRFNVDDRSYIFCCPTEPARDLWIRLIKEAKERRKEPEEKTVSTNNPTVTKTQLNQGLKEVRIERQIGQGLGCTIKTIGGVTCVGRILEDGPVSTTGVLRPGDEIIEVNGIKVFGLSMAEISKIIRASPEIVVVTIKPVDSKPTFGHVTPKTESNGEYIKVDHEKTEERKRAREAEEREVESNITTLQDFGPAPQVPSRSEGRTKKSHAHEYEDDEMTAALKRQSSVSEEKDQTNMNHGSSDEMSDTPMKVSERAGNECDSEYVNVNTDTSEASGKEINYIILDFPPTADDEEHAECDKDNVTHED